MIPVSEKVRENMYLSENTRVPPSGHCLAGMLSWTLIADFDEAIYYSMVASPARVRKC